MEDTHGEHTRGFTEDGHEVVIPVSAGIPPIIKISAVVGIILIFIVASLVLTNSGFGHVWPSSDSPKILLKDSNGS